CICEMPFVVAEFDPREISFFHYDRAFRVCDPRLVATESVQPGLIRRFDPAIYPGRYATCVYDPDKALCTRAQNLSGQNAPTLGGCRPLECRNVALTSGNLDELRSESSDIERELERTPSLPPLLQHRLRQRSEQINQFVDRHDPNSIR
ncbi:hypothetical protein, partial [Rhodococcus sp. KRD197]|uniref:hypothetical protein n=1 Tax=Rhodococcus sp. KRD197 TaxID=2729731 RepID=UPI0019D1BC0A